MTTSNQTVAEQRDYNVLTVKDARDIATIWLENMELEGAMVFGLPEIDDRYHVWRVPLVGKNQHGRVGEIVIDAQTSLICENKTTSKEILEERLLRKRGRKKKRSKNNEQYKVSALRNTIACGDAEDILQQLPEESIDLVFTSPPYYNARPEYTEYITYEEYLLKIRKVIQLCHRVLNEGRFFVMNVSPVLIRRASRNESSKRIAVPFDIHRLFIEEGFDFIDDIIWEKPEGAGWATGRGRRFAADRNPLQYKAVPVTEYVLVYRKRTDRLIDWNIRAHPKQELVQASRIADGYETTNIWRIKPAHDKKHPAVFPEELATKVIAYYSFVDDVVLDPFAGVGTVGQVATKLDRRFVLIEINPEYAREICQRAKKWLGKKEVQDVFLIDCPPISVDDMLL
ncbi:MAG: site-specific DNA-methyltransferase [Chloroflexi bacterium]|nr:MAG: site-specific DNA-methyltransferase [Anaerolineaceae bacterium 4572_32.2]RLC78638.1 MAG: site-specific DNA-methyltransferase [Chloroflexota bacterium]RLC85070.1 MAG: site-specific DNA-methyltransferase [Chloroflexota bacterium]HEY73458.1 site-specific DNA-methyltransferase [Thermoflexia bacterium]